MHYARIMQCWYIPNIIILKIVDIQKKKCRKIYNLKPTHFTPNKKPLKNITIDIIAKQKNGLASSKLQMIFDYFQKILTYLY